MYPLIASDGNIVINDVKMVMAIILMNYIPFPLIKTQNNNMSNLQFPSSCIESILRLFQKCFVGSQLNVYLLIATFFSKSCINIHNFKKTLILWFLITIFVINGHMLIVLTFWYIDGIIYYSKSIDIYIGSYRYHCCQFV